MGILRNQHERKLFKVEEAAAQAQQEHQITYADYIFDDTESEHSDVDEDVSELRESPRCRPVRRAHLRAPLNMLTYDGPKIKSGMGARKLRRLEHISCFGPNAPFAD
ncbi:hypothetical protein L596_002352 [Steinernema carpocapsae]|uniref:Uncharacterized protein n=1 Tax=Steinernema carpocapsae TaxID=34508 RepID=A0A4V6I7F2_STECR|nr:hypothetical protein L596_002352 [Steinernema carpocapsae]